MFFHKPNIILLDTLNIVNFEGKMPLKLVVLSIIGIGVFMITILVPASMILGFEKGRYVLVFIMVAPMCFSTNLVEMLPNINLNTGGTATTIIIILVAITLILAFYFVTSNLYSKKKVV